MNNNYNPNDIDDLEFDYDTEDKVEEGSKYIEESFCQLSTVCTE